jgi:hypothetical protein
MFTKEKITDAQTEMEPRISIFVCCHQPVAVPYHRLLVPLQVGAELSTERYPGYIYDNSNDNISDKNKYYCELTGEYWAWKNYEADYYGFFHYRRFLYPDEHTTKPYTFFNAPTSEILKKLNYDNFSTVISKHDVIAPIAEDMHISVRDHYHNSKSHSIRDLYKIEEIISRQFPDYISAMDHYLSGTKLFFGNIFIMRKEVFFAYCSWLFDILNTFDVEMASSKESNIESTSFKKSNIGIRTEGYLGERLFGIYLTKWRNELDILYLPRAHFVPNTTERIKSKSINTILPPGSKRRAIIKNLLKSDDYK